MHTKIRAVYSYISDLPCANHMLFFDNTPLSWPCCIAVSKWLDPYINILLLMDKNLRYEWACSREEPGENEGKSSRESNKHDVNRIKIIKIYR